MSRWEETSYPVPRRALRVWCVSCGVAVAGRLRGSGNIRSILKEIKAHDDHLHRPYDPSVIQAVARAVEELNDGAPTRRVGRLAIEPADATSSALWRRSAEVLEQHIGVLVGQKTHLERALDRLMRERDNAVRERDLLRDRLVEAQKEIDVLQGVRDSLRAELIKAQPSRRNTGLLAEVAKAAASAVVGSVITLGAQWTANLDNIERSAATVVEHADIVVNECDADVQVPVP